MDAIKILVVEDDKEVNSLITKYVRKEGFSVDFSYSGTHALELIGRNTYNLLVLDLMIPGADGFEVLRRVRGKSAVPVIIVSARGDETDKLVGLGIGADDYIVKPFSIRELIARIKVQIRRYVYYHDNHMKPDTEIISCGGLELNCGSYIVKKGGTDKALTPIEFRILRLLLENRGRVFTRSQIRGRVWNEGYCLEDNTIMVHIRNIRRKIEDDPSNPRIIRTVWGIGYMADA